jgi:hypothetical protein
MMIIEGIRTLFEQFCLLVAGGSLTVPRVRAVGAVAGQRVDTTVDSEAARYYVEGSRRFDAANRLQYQRVDELRSSRAGGSPSAETMEAIAAEFSSDVAAMYLADQLMAMERNREFIDLLQAQFNHLRSLSAEGRKPPPLPESYLLLFVPGWHYKTYPEYGAGFTRPRRILTEMGLIHEMMEIDENGTIDANAELIAERIREYSRTQKNIILVSASKSGPEVASAIGGVLSPAETECITAWINIGGVLQGCHLAVESMKWPQGWLAKIFFAYKGWSTASVESMTPARCRERFSRVRIPEHITVLNYIGVPLSGNICAKAKNNYRRLRRYGANDGLSLLTDELVAEGISVVEMGVDHYYIGPDMDMKAVALAYSTVAWLEGHARSRISAQR